MADEPTNEPQPCPPCHGTGKVISNLGGSPKELTCPWCDGGGVFLPDHDAQEHHVGAAAGDGTADDAG